MFPSEGALAAACDGAPRTARSVCRRPPPPVLCGQQPPRGPLPPRSRLPCSRVKRCHHKLNLSLLWKLRTQAQQLHKARSAQVPCASVVSSAPSEWGCQANNAGPKFQISTIECKIRMNGNECPKDLSDCCFVTSRWSLVKPNLGVIFEWKNISLLTKFYIPEIINSQALHKKVGDFLKYCLLQSRRTA